MNKALTFSTIYSLNHSGISELRGIAPDGTLYVTEFYDGEHLAQYIIRPDGSCTVTDNTDTPLAIPPEAKLTPPEISLEALHFYAGAPLRGLRADDHIDSLVYSLEVADKMRLAEQLRLSVPAPMLIGISESRVLSIARLSPDTALICRRVRFAHMLVNPQPDANYDTITLHLIQHIDLAAAFDLLTFGGVIEDEHLHTPTQCAMRDNTLYVADVGRIIAYKIAI